MLISYLVFTLFVAIFFAAVISYIRQKVYYRPLSKLPGVPPTFLIGNVSWVVRLYRTKNLKYQPGVYILERVLGFCKLFEKTGMHYFWMGNSPFVSIYRAEIVELVLSSSVSIEKSMEYTFLHKWLGTGLLTSTDKKWRQRRKLLTPSFHFRILEDFLPVFNHQSLILVQKLKSLTHKEYINITPYIVLCTLDAICETVMGVSIEAQKGNNSEYVQAIHNLADYFNKRLVHPWLWSDFLFGLTRMGQESYRDIDILHNFTEKVIKEKKEKLLKKDKISEPTDESASEFFEKQRKTFMDLLLDMHVNGQQLSEADIREEVDTFMFEGHDTTAMAITFTLYCIGLYPDVQKKISDEIKDIFGDDISRPVTQDDTRNLKYLECVLKSANCLANNTTFDIIEGNTVVYAVAYLIPKFPDKMETESQRLFPPVPEFGRKLNEDIHFENFMIPKDTEVHIYLPGLHRNSNVFKNPEVFDPERFYPENSLNRHPYAFVPFSAGPRNCIGQKFAMLEEKTIICNILRHFEIFSIDPRDKFHFEVQLTLKPAQEVRMKFIPRF